MNALQEFWDGVRADYGIGRDDLSKAFYLSRDKKDILDDDAPRLVKMAAEHPLIFRVREMLGKADPSAVEARNELGIGLKPTAAGKAGQLVGSLGADLTQDTSRNWWWLFNAPQATANVINETAMGLANKDLYGAVQTDIPYKDLNALEKAGYARRNADGNLERDPRVQSNKGKAKVRNYRSGNVGALAIPAGAVINNSLGLLTPGGGYEGYEAVFPSEEDKSKTNNMVAEVAAKYILGRTGNLLPYEEFKKVRPDVSKGEYLAYKAYKFDKNTDLNPMDGDITLPAGVLKATTEGIHGPEVQFLGRSLPLTTGIVPFLTSVAGGVAGVRKRKQFGKPGVGEIDPDAVKRGFIGATAGAVGGSIVGNLIEQERRNRNMRENERKSQQVPQQGF